jgi:hypothetical protein
MRATHGFAVQFRNRGRLIGCCMALVFAVCAVAFTPKAGAAETPVYLATGDSLAFGYTQEKFAVNFPTESPSFYEEGYPHFYGLALKKANPGLITVNDGCPGETVEGFIGENPEVGGSASTETETETREGFFGPKDYQGPGDHHPCKYHYHFQLPLHNGGYYNPKTGKPVSQLEEIAATLKGGKPAHKIPSLTLNIGANDELAQITLCESEVATEFKTKGYSEREGKKFTNPEEAVTQCLIESVVSPTGVFQRIFKGIEDILNVTLGAGYKSLEEKGESGPIKVLGSYNPLAFVIRGSDGLTKIFNAQLAGVIKKYEPLVKLGNPYMKINGVTENAKIEEVNIGCTKALVAIGETPGHEGGDCETAQEGKYTEEGNPFDEAANKKAAEEKGEPYNGAGDIHPTPKGAGVLAKVLAEA